MDTYVLSLGAGAGIGVIIPQVLQNYVEPTYGPIIPGLEALQNWGRWSVFVPLVAGASTLLVSQFTNWVANKSKVMNDAMGVFGITSLTYGALNGIFSIPAGLRARAPARARPMVTRLATAGTPTGISGKVIVA